MDNRSILFKKLNKDIELNYEINKVNKFNKTNKAV